MKQTEEEAQQALYIEIYEEILKQYHRYILRHSPWMKKNIALLFGHDITGWGTINDGEFRTRIIINCRIK